MPFDPFNAWLLPATAPWRAGEAWLQTMHEAFSASGEDGRAPEFLTANEVVLDLPTMRLRRWRGDREAVAAVRARRHAPGPARRRTAPAATLVVAPYALHHASIADLAPGHSILGRLMAEGLGDVWLTEWKSATPATAGTTIDSLLEDLLVAVEEVGGRADLVGLCQGGWLSLVFAGRFPLRVRRLVLAGAPVDFAAAPSRLSQAVHDIPPAVMDSVVGPATGRVLGRHLLALWGIVPLDDAAMQEMLQREDAPDAAVSSRVQDWYLHSVDLPGAYFAEVVDRLFRHNAIAAGDFVALGRTLSLRGMKAPLCLLVGLQDDIAPPGQALAARDLVGTRARDVLVLRADCGHLPLFLGRRTLEGPWTRIAGWLRCGEP